MKKEFIVYICLACTVTFLQAAIAIAKDKKPGKTVPAPELAVSKQDCMFLTTEYKEAPGVEYQPGVDVHGKPVMEADVTPSVIKPPKKISFDITVDVAKYMGITAPAGLEGQAKMGTITVENGQMSFNGNPLEGDEAATLKALCGTAKRHTKNN